MRTEVAAPPLPQEAPSWSQEHRCHPLCPCLNRPREKYTSHMTVDMGHKSDFPQPISVFHTLTCTCKTHRQESYTMMQQDITPPSYTIRGSDHPPFLGVVLVPFSVRKTFQEAVGHTQECLLFQVKKQVQTKTVIL